MAAPGSTHRADFAWRAALSPRTRFEAGGGAGPPAARHARVAARHEPAAARKPAADPLLLAREAEIGLAGLHQARAGGNRAMIANAERYLVTNIALTTRQRGDLVAPWLRDETRSFLADSRPGTREIPETAPPPAWRLAADRKREETKLQDEAERELNRRLEELVAKQTSYQEYQRAHDIMSRRDALNDELLEVASMASGEAFNARLSQLDAAQARAAPEVTTPGGILPGAALGRGLEEDEDSAERALALRDIADHLTLVD